MKGIRFSFCRRLPNFSIPDLSSLDQSFTLDRKPVSQSNLLSVMMIMPCWVQNGIHRGPLLNEPSVFMVCLPFLSMTFFLNMYLHFCTLSIYYFQSNNLLRYVALHYITFNIILYFSLVSRVLCFLIIWKVTVRIQAYSIMLLFIFNIYYFKM